MTKDELIQMGRDVSDIRFMRGYVERTFEDVIAQGRAWSRFRAALRDHPDPQTVADAKQAEIDQMFAWEPFHNGRARPADGGAAMKRLEEYRRDRALTLYCFAKLRFAGSRATGFTMQPSAG
jgi:hypothetical protein